MGSWEYKVLRTEGHPNDLFFAASQAGKQGWEMVGPVGYYLYFKRPLPPTTQEGPKP